MPLIAVIAGPTASGKSALAMRWAQARGYGIVSADSRQVYRGFAIGTGAATEAEQALVPHHLVGHVDPREPYSPQRFRAEAQAAVESVMKSRPDANFLVVGGTGLYLKEWMRPSGSGRGDTPPEVRAAAEREIAQRGAAAVHAELLGKDPGGMGGVAPQDAYRIQKRLENWLLTGRSYVKEVTEPPNPLFMDVPFVWLDPPRETLHRQIEARVRAMFAGGWIREVEGLRREYDPATTPAFNALGYREIAEALQAGSLSADATVAPEELIQPIVARTRQYAKKQVTFFRRQFSDPAGSSSGLLEPQGMAPEILARRLESSDWDPNALRDAVSG